MSEGMSYREINDRKEAQHGFGHLAKHKKKIAVKMPEEHKGPKRPFMTYEHYKKHFEGFGERAAEFKSKGQKEWEKRKDSLHIMPHKKKEK